MKIENKFERKIKTKPKMSQSLQNNKQGKVNLTSNFAFCCKNPQQFYVEEES